MDEQTVKKLILIKQNQIEAVNDRNWVKLSELSTEFQALCEQCHIDSSSFNESNIQAFHHLNDLNNQLIKMILKLREKTLKELLNIKKGKIAAKTYQNESHSLIVRL